MKTSKVISIIVLVFFFALAWINHLAFQDSDIPKESSLMYFPLYWVLAGLVMFYTIRRVFKPKSNRVPSPFNTYPE